MLVLTNIVYKDKEFKFYRYSRNLDCVSFCVKDTDSNKDYNNLSANGVLNLSENILGVVKTNDDILFIYVDVVTWMLLDYIDEVKSLGAVEDLETYLGVSFIEKKIVHKCGLTKYKSESGIVYFFKMYTSVKRLDKYGIFWFLNHDIIWTLSSFYQILYDMDCSNCIALYIIDENNNVIKLEVSNDILRLMTKVSVMSGSLHW